MLKPVVQWEGRRKASNTRPLKSGFFCMSGKDYNINFNVRFSEIAEDVKDELLFRAFDVLLSEADISEEVKNEVNETNKNEANKNQDLCLGD